MRKILALWALVLGAALPAAALPPGIASATISGNTVTARVSLPGGLGADVDLSFGNVSGLSLANLGLSAALVNPFDPAFFSRLPSGSVLALPVVLRIEPPVAGGLAFHGVSSLSIHTENLQYTVGTPLRLFAAHAGESFKDITNGMGAGSYRARGTEGGFSDFVIVVDLRSLTQVLRNKFDQVEDELDEYAGDMPAALHADLAARLAAARDDAAHGDRAAAIQELDGFLAVVQLHSGTDIPDLWRSARDVDNAAGYLREAALTLRFSLGLSGSFLGF
jgi:uncharacterized protein DUF6689